MEPYGTPSIGTTRTGRKTACANLDTTLAAGMEFGASTREMRYSVLSLRRACPLTKHGMLQLSANFARQNRIRLDFTTGVSPRSVGVSDRRPNQIRICVPCNYLHHDRPQRSRVPACTPIPALDPELAPQRPFWSCPSKWGRDSSGTLPGQLETAPGFSAHDAVSCIGAVIVALRRIAHREEQIVIRSTYISPPPDRPNFGDDQ